MAADYIPPPAGPYKPVSDLYNETQAAVDESGQVYRFPSEDMIRLEQEKVNNSAAEPGKIFRDNAQNQVPLTEPVNLYTQPRKASETAAKRPFAAAPAQTGPSAGFYTANPWAAGSSAIPPASSQSGWSGYSQGYSGYSYAPPYPYTYDYRNAPGNQGYMPYANMPSPWSMMPMQSFFPGN